MVNGDIYITCRDQLVILRDLNKDGDLLDAGTRPVKYGTQA